MADTTTKDYYGVLGVPRTATAEEVKAAYRSRAKELHPDKNRQKDATAKFQRLQEAFSVLGSPERRQLYDQGSFKEAVDPATKATEADFDPVHCAGCGCISAQPRFVQYDRVISAIFASFKVSPAGIFCPKCASRRLFGSTFLTGAVGWLGVWGFFWSVAALIRNLSGGTKPAGLNAFVLAKQAAYFLQEGKPELASVLAAESLQYFQKLGLKDPDYDLAKTGAAVARQIASLPQSSRLKLRSRWTGWSYPARYALAGFALPAVAWTFMLSSGSNSTASARTAPVRPTAYATAGTSAVEPDVKIEGRDGRVYTVSMPVYRRLKPIYDGLETRQIRLKAEYDSLDSGHERLDTRRRTLDTSDTASLNSFNQAVDLWNAQNQKLKTTHEAFQHEIDAYNDELERVGRISR